MSITEIVTVLAGALAIFWTLVQIIAHARGQDSRNLKIAVLLVVALAVFFAFLQVIKPRIPDSLRVKLPAMTPQVPHTVIIMTTAAAPPNPSPPPTASSPVITPEAQPQPAPTASPAPEETPPAAPQPSESMEASPSKTMMKSSFIIDISRNMLGGIGGISAQCTFAELGGRDVEIVSYFITIAYQDDSASSGGASNVRNLERALKERILVPANKTVEKKVSFDSEIGDLLLKSKKSGAQGSVSIVWTGRDQDGNLITSETAPSRVK
ncbi:MAG: hypothetical protein RDV48_06130 [Candidatus Eremiobacteraeota bacterium]|nr:hypothetical protein [Candidatus Eremiobacteraeota bacterium]